MNKNILIIIVTLLIGLGGGYWIASQNKSGIDVVTNTDGGERKVVFWRNPMNPSITSPIFTKDEMGMDYIPVYADKEKPKTEKTVLFWRNPMNPLITSPVFSKDEMGMDYIPVYADNEQAADEPTGTVRIDATTVQNIGVRTAIVQRKTLSRLVRAVGRVTFDEQRISRLHPKIEGWIEALNIEKTGEMVKRDTILLSIYSPQLVATQQEYLLALNNYDVLKLSPFADIQKGAKDLVQSSRERLMLLDVPEHQIQELELTRSLKKNLHIHSPYSGIVINVGVRKGQYVTPKDELYMLADLSKVWVHVDIYEDEMPWVRVHDEVDMTVTAAPGLHFRGRVSYIYPYLESKTRTVKVRLEFNNQDGMLKPDMFAEVNLHANRQVDALVIPSEAVVRSGNREQVYLVRGKGKFEPREVSLGVTSGGQTQILKGVEEGDIVVSSSQFLIDSESKLREATAKMMETSETNVKQKGDMSPILGLDDADMDMSNMNLEDSRKNELDMSDMTLDNIHSRPVVKLKND